MGIVLDDDETYVCVNERSSDNWETVGSKGKTSVYVVWGCDETSVCVVWG